MAEPHAERQKPAKLRRLAASGVPHAKLIDVVSRIREMDIHDLAINRQSLDRASAELYRKVEQKETLPGIDFLFSTASFTKTLQLFVRESVAFRHVLREMWLREPCSMLAPFSLVVYADEVVPGNVLRLDNARKIFCVYITIKEIGPSFLKSEHMWVPVAAIRTTRIKHASGEISACMKVLMERMFIHDRVREQGVLLDLQISGAQPVVFYFQLGNAIADGDAYRAMWAAKGASGKLPCLLCKNILKDADDIPRGSTYLRHMSCSSPDLFDAASDADIWEKADVLTLNSGGAKTKLQQMQKVFGLNFSPHGILFDKPLRTYIRPASCITFDSMHALVSNGIVEVETGHLLGQLRNIGCTWDQLRSFFAANWRYCKANGSTTIAKAAMSKARQTAFEKSGEFKSGASEMLQVFPLLLHFLFTVVKPTGALAAEIASYHALGCLLSATRRGKNGEDVQAELKAAATAHADLYAAAYGAGVKPKHHYTQHLSGQVGRDGVIIDAFVGERKHRMIKMLAQDIKNTKDFERSLLQRVICYQLDRLQDPHALRDYLHAPQEFQDLAILEGCRQSFVSSTMVWTGILIGTDDCLFLDGFLHEIVACATLDDAFAVIANVYVKTHEVHHRIIRLLLLCCVCDRYVGSSTMIRCRADRYPRRCLIRDVSGILGVNIHIAS